MRRAPNPEPGSVATDGPDEVAPPQSLGCDRPIDRAQALRPRTARGARSQDPDPPSPVGKVSRWTLKLRAVTVRLPGERARCLPGLANLDPPGEGARPGIQVHAGDGHLAVTVRGEDEWHPAQLPGERRLRTRVADLHHHHVADAWSRGTPFDAGRRRAAGGQAEQEAQEETDGKDAPGCGHSAEAVTPGAGDAGTARSPPPARRPGGDRWPEAAVPPPRPRAPWTRAS